MVLGIKVGKLPSTSGSVVGQNGANLVVSLEAHVAGVTGYLVPVVDQVSERVEQPDEYVELKHRHVIVLGDVESSLQSSVLLVGYDAETLFPGCEHLHEMRPVHDTSGEKKKKSFFLFPLTLSKKKFNIFVAPKPVFFFSKVKSHFSITMEFSVLFEF